MKTRVFTLLLFFLTREELTAQRKSAPVRHQPSADSLAAISKRGRALAEYDSIAWLGAGAMTSLFLPQDSIRRLISRRTNRGWEVAAGSLTANGDFFLMSHLATPGITPGPQWASTWYDPPRVDTGYFARAARARCSMRYSPSICARCRSAYA